MGLLGIKQYPDSLRKPLLYASILGLLSMLEGFGALLWLLLEPSEPGNRFLLVYSLERWIMVLVTLMFTLMIALILWNIKYRSGWIKRRLDTKGLRILVRKGLGVVTLLAVVILILVFWASGNKLTRVYFFRSLPLLALFSSILLQTWIVLIIVQRRIIIQRMKEYFATIQDKQVFPLRPSGIMFFILILFSIFYLVLQFEAYLDVLDAVPLGDTASYLEGAGLDLSDPDFFSERRPWGMLLAYKLMGRSFSNIEIVQLSVSAFAWLWLAWVFSRSLRSGWSKLVGFLVVLGFSLSPTVQVWNHAALSESFTISFTILILTALVFLNQEWKWQVLIVLVLSVIFWMSIHEVNLYTGLLMATVFIAIGIFCTQCRMYWIVAVCIVIVFILNYRLSSDYGLPRWALPLAEVITIRILPNQEFLAFFSENGMPVTPELMALSGQWAHSDNYAIINSIELRPFSKWLFSRGKIVYANFLLKHPFYTIEAPLENIRILLASDYYSSIPIPNYTAALPAALNELLYPIRWFYSYLWIALLGLGFSFARVLSTEKRVYWVVLIFWMLSIPNLYLSWHGDALEIARHAVIANVQFHLGVWLLLVLFLDHLITTKCVTSESYCTSLM